VETVFTMQSAQRLYNEYQLWLLSRWVELLPRVELEWVSEVVKRWQLVSSARELTNEGKYQLKPAVRGWCEMVTSLRGWTQKHRNVCCWNQCDGEHWSVCLCEVVSCETDASQRGRKLRSRCQAAPGEDTKNFVRAAVICYVCRSVNLL
jgi:hypothetical protein